MTINPFERAGRKAESSVANLKEIALGVTAALQFGPEPEPLSIALWGQSPEEATFLLRAIIDECADAGVPLAKVRIDDVMLRRFDAGESGDERLYRRVVIEAVPTLNASLELFRRA